MGHKIKAPAQRSGARILGPDTRAEDERVAFAFYHTAPGYGLEDHPDDDLLQFVDAIRKRRGLTWTDLHGAQRRGLGVETIKRSSITATIPDWLTPDKTIYSLRCGGIRRMIGYREGRVFVIVWLDCNGSAYDHGD